MNEPMTDYHRYVLATYYKYLLDRYGKAALLRTIRRINRWIAQPRKMELIETRYIFIVTEGQP